MPSKIGSIFIERVEKNTPKRYKSKTGEIGNMGGKRCHLKTKENSKKKVQAYFKNKQNKNQVLNGFIRSCKEKCSNL